MKSFKINKILVSTAVFLLLMASFQQKVFSQSDFQILKIFEKYGSAKGVTMLEITNELMKDYKIDHFKSIIFEDGTEALPEIRQAIESDKEGAKLIKESIKDGFLESGYYRLRTDERLMNRYLIFKIGSNNKVTLIFIEGELTPEQLVDLLK